MLGDVVGAAVTDVVDEFVEARGEYVMYTRRAKFEKAPTPIDARWLLRDGKVAGLDFRPAN